jgi:hypothetical protein
MTVSKDDVRNWLGMSTTMMSDTALTECLSMATEYCGAYLSAMGVGASGNAYDIATKYMTAVNVYRNLDARGIKPDSLHAAELTLATNTAAAIDQFTKLAENALQMAVISGAPNKRDIYARHIRAGRGMP